MLDERLKPPQLLHSIFVKADLAFFTRDAIRQGLNDPTAGRVLKEILYLFNGKAEIAQFLDRTHTVHAGVVVVAIAAFRIYGRGEDPFFFVVTQGILAHAESAGNFSDGIGHEIPPEKKFHIFFTIRLTVPSWYTLN